MTARRRLRRLVGMLVTGVLAVAPFACQAHDTWFATKGPWWTGDVFLSLGTGERFPVHDLSVGAESLERLGCRAGAKPVRLKALTSLGRSLLLHSRVPGRSALSCWAQLKPSEIELTPALVAVYLEEAQAPATVRQGWASLQARGLPWRERYTKNVRIELGDGPTAPAPGTELALDMQLERSEAPLTAGSTARVRVLREGRPLADFPVELVSTAGQGRWSRTDAQGRLALPLPQAGRWLARGIDIRPSASVPDAWESHFISLTFDVAPAPVAVAAGR